MPARRLTFRDVVSRGQLSGALGVRRPTHDRGLDRQAGKSATNQVDGAGGEVDPDPLASELFAGVNRGPATTERVKHDVPRS